MALNSIVFGAIILFLIRIVGTEERCGNELGKSLICPSDDYPDHYTKCCWNATNVYCCPHEITPVAQDDNMIVMIIGLTVIFTCLSVAVIIVICCFWSRCPLYDMCRVNYTYGDIVAYTKEEEANTLPPEGPDGCNHYSPCQVKVKQVPDI